MRDADGSIEKRRYRIKGTAGVPERDVLQDIVKHQEALEMQDEEAKQPLYDTDISGRVQQVHADFTRSLAHGSKVTYG